MRRFIDFVLIVLVLAAVSFGAYAIGHRVDHASTSLSSQDSELHGTTLAAGQTAKSSNKHRTEIIVGAALGGTAVLIVLGSLAGTLMRARKRDYWRAG